MTRPTLPSTPRPHPDESQVGVDVAGAVVHRSERSRRADPQRVDRQRFDRGAATTLSLVLLTPMMLVLGLAAFQAALWSHARTEARVVARDTAALVARSGADPGVAASSATVILERDAILREVIVTADVSDDLVVVVVQGRAPGMLRGTWIPLEVTAAVPLERRVP